MAKTRRKFLKLLATALPAAAATGELFSQSLASPTEAAPTNLWSQLANIKMYPAKHRIKELSALSGQQAELTGFLSELSETTTLGPNYILTFQRISCCVECSILGPDPFVLVEAQSQLFNRAGLVRLQGQLHVGDKFSFGYLHLGDARIT